MEQNLKYESQFDAILKSEGSPNQKAEQMVTALFDTAGINLFDGVGACADRVVNHAYQTEDIGSTAEFLKQIAESIQNGQPYDGILAEMEQETRAAYDKRYGQGAYEAHENEEHEYMKDMESSFGMETDFGINLGVETNMGSIPMEDYREIIAAQYGFDSYAEMQEEGYSLENDLSSQPAPFASDSTHTLIIQDNSDEVAEKIELEIMLGAISNEDISKINALNNKYPDPLSYTLLDREGLILASGAVTPGLGDRINVIEDKVYDLQHRYRYPIEITEEALKALDRFQTSEYPLNHFQEENEMPESFIIWSDDGKNPSEFVLYNPISEKYSHVIPSKDVMEVSDTIRMAEQYMTKEQIGRFDSVRLGLPDKDAERGKEKDFKEITLKFGKGCVGDEFKGRDGTAYRQILVPNVDKNDSRPWQTFVVKANAVHKDKFGKGVWIKLPADGHTTLKRSVAVGKKPDGKKEWGVEETRVSNADLKKMMESYKEKSKPSLTGKLVNKNAEAKQENSSKQQGKDIKEKSTKQDLS